MKSRNPLPAGEGLRPRQAQRPVGRKGEGSPFPERLTPHPPHGPAGYALRHAGSIGFSRREKERPRTRNLLGLAASLLLAACATTPELGWQARHAASEALREATRFAEDPLPLAWTDVAVTATPVPINDADLEAGTGQLIYAGGVEITSDFNRLHGLSDIKFEDATNFWSITDEGLLVRGRIQLDASGRLVGVEGMQVRPLVDPDNQPLIPKYLADAEGLALMPNGELLVSFERAHRVWRYDREGRWLGERVIPDFPFTENEGMEGIAAAGEGDFWVTGENGGVWRCSLLACLVASHPSVVPPADSDLRTTSLDGFQQGVRTLRWWLDRAYDPSRNANTIRISQSTASGDSQLLQELATFTAPATVDNFEGIAAVRRPDGRVRLYILSDDNFNPGQRTLLLAFDVR